MQQLIDLYQQTFGTLPARVEPLTQAGSGRQYARLSDAAGAKSVVGCRGTSVRENDAFVYLADHLAAAGLPVPQVLAQSADRLCYLQTDLGRESLFDRLRPSREAGGQYAEAEVQLLEAAVGLLPRFQLVGYEGLDASKLLPPTAFTPRTALYDLNYFKYCFLRTTPTDYDEDALQDDLERFAADLTASVEPRLMYRDFQARNVMLREGQTPYLIDFQGARLGPPAYDLAAFLMQASARYSPALRQHLLRVYINRYKEIAPLDEARFTAQLRHMMLFRTLQVLGAYGLRGRFERKHHFLQSIPPALQNVRALLEVGACEAYPALAATLRAMLQCEEPQPLPHTPQPAEASPLVVRVFSFSYKRGIPADESGNGGGYVFDCRAPHNPGRYDEYKQLTGLDQPVIDFLERDGEIQPFLDNVYRLADFHVARYMERGFTNLMFSFGCTGGQHRSVYSAQHLAEHLHKRFGIEVRLQHREQGIARVFPAKRR